MKICTKWKAVFENMQKMKSRIQKYVETVKQDIDIRIKLGKVEYGNTQKMEIII